MAEEAQRERGSDNFDPAEIKHGRHSEGCVLIWLAALPTLVVFVVNRAIANDGIIINVICAGWVLTPLVQKQIDERAAAEGKTEGGHA